MVEALALGASIIAVIQAADRIEKICRFFIETVDNYPSDLRLILVESSSLKTAFQNLEFIEKHDLGASNFLKKLRAPGGPVAGCLQSISKLEKLVSPRMLPDASRTAKGGRPSLSWPP